MKNSYNNVVAVRASTLAETFVAAAIIKMSLHV